MIPEMAYQSLCSIEVQIGEANAYIRQQAFRVTKSFNNVEYEFYMEHAAALLCNRKCGAIAREQVICHVFVPYILSCCWDLARLPACASTMITVLFSSHYLLAAADHTKLVICVYTPTCRQCPVLIIACLKLYLC